MFSQVDVFNKAAECERLMELETDNAQRSAYRTLRDMWVNLANDCASMSLKEFTQGFDDLDEIQSRFRNGKKD